MAVCPSSQTGGGPEGMIETKKILVLISVMLYKYLKGKYIPLYSVDGLDVLLDDRQSKEWTGNAS